MKQKKKQTKFPWLLEGAQNLLTQGRRSKYRWFTIKQTKGQITDRPILRSSIRGMIRLLLFYRFLSYGQCHEVGVVKEPWRSVREIVHSEIWMSFPFTANKNKRPDCMSTRTGTLVAEMQSRSRNLTCLQWQIHGLTPGTIVVPEISSDNTTKTPSRTWIHYRYQMVCGRSAQPVANESRTFFFKITANKFISISIY